MPKTIETTLYAFGELSPEAKIRARDWYRSAAPHDDWYDFVYEDFEAICTLLGITLSRRATRLHGGGTGSRPCIWFSGFSSQGDGASFEGSYAYRARSLRALSAHAPGDAVLRDIARRMQALQRRHFYRLTATISQRGRYVHARTMDVDVLRSDGAAVPEAVESDLTACLRDLADWLYRQLEREWDFRVSDEAVDEDIEANALLFTDEGRRWCHG